MKSGIPLGNASVSFPEPVFIQSAASIVGEKEGNGPLGGFFDQVSQDAKFGADTWENAERSSPSCHPKSGTYPF